VLGDGNAMPAQIRVVVKASPIETLEGKTARVRELAKVLGGAVVKRGEASELAHAPTATDAIYASI